MGKPIIPFGLQMATALIGKNEGAASRITAQAIDSISHDLIAVANSYDMNDLPFVIASMKILSEALSGALNESGKIICDSIVNNTTAISFNADALREALEHGLSEE